MEQKFNFFWLNESLTVTGENFFMQTPNVSKEIFLELVAKNEAGTLLIEELQNLFLDEQRSAIAEKAEQDKKRSAITELIEKGQPFLTLEMRDGALYMVGVPVAMTETIAQAFLTAIDKGDVERINALQKFWVLTARNPNDRTRKDLDTFLQRGQFQLASNGWIVGYRSAHTVIPKNESLGQFVKVCLEKVKSWKKTPADYAIYEAANEYGYKLRRANLPTQTGLVHNLEKLSGSERDYTTGVYTDDHTHKMRLIPGEFVIDSNVEDNPLVTCGKGLHFVNQDAVGVQYYTQHYGNQYMIVLVNPAKMRAIPISDDSNKARTSEYFFLNTLDRDPETDLPIVPKHYQRETIILSEQLTEKLNDRDLSDLLEMLKDEFASGYLQVGDVHKMVKAVNVPQINENVFEAVLRKVEEVDALTVPKKYMDVYTEADYVEKYLIPEQQLWEWENQALNEDDENFDEDLDEDFKDEDFKDEDDEDWGWPEQTY